MNYQHLVMALYIGVGCIIHYLAGGAPLANFVYSALAAAVTVMLATAAGLTRSYSREDTALQVLAMIALIMFGLVPFFAAWLPMPE